MLRLHLLFSFRRHSVTSLGLLVFLSLIPTETPASASEVAWYRYGSCDPGQSSFTTQQQPPLRIACGALGVYYLGDGGLEPDSSCGFEAHGLEEPALYPSQQDPRFQPSAGEWFPCRHGGCFGRRAHSWVAVIDWDQGHGWSVAGLIREVAGSGVDLELFPLDQNSSLAADEGVSDLDVLRQLCAVAQRAWQAPQDLPLAVNMSFGRLLDPEASRLASLAGQVAFQDEIYGVLEHLGADLGIQLVAAAGNHGRLLFPASHPRVMSAGGVDIEQWLATGLADPSRQTPAGTDALLPGYGIYLDEGGSGGYWPVPAGSSYASAMATGWIAGYLATNGLRSTQLGLHDDSSLGFLANGHRYLLTLDGQPLTGSDLGGGSAIVQRALEHPSAVCPGLASSPTTVTPVLATPTLPADSAAELAAGTTVPMPNTRPCVPCHGRQRDGGLEIDLSRSEGLPATWTLQSLFLRVGDQYYRVTDPSVRADFAAGLLDYLFFDGIGGIPAGTAVSLVYTIQVPSVAAFWDSTPVHLHGG